MTQQRSTIGPFEALMVMERVGLDPWDQLNWFVQMAQKDLEHTTEGERLSLQEELAALELTTTIRDLRASGPSVSLLGWGSVQDFQTVLRHFLDDWVDTGRVLLQPPHPSMLEIRRATSPMDRPKSVEKRIPGQGEHISRYHFEDQVQCLLYRFFELFDKHASAIARCPHCSRIFLKLRRHARYCSRKCHSVAGMRLKREQERKQKTERRKKMKARRARASRKEKAHGTKRT